MRSGKPRSALEIELSESNLPLQDFLKARNSRWRLVGRVQFAGQIAEILDKQAGVPVGWYGTIIPSRIAALIHAFAGRSQPLSPQLAQGMLRILDRLVDMGDRRSAALQTSEIFKNVRQQFRALE